MALRIDQLLDTYPRRRPPLPAAYQEVYEREYLLNRSGGTYANSLALWAESWMHHVVAGRGKPGSVLEIGAGTLNHLAFEPDAHIYDVVEPFKAFYAGSPNISRVRRFFSSIDQVPQNARYSRIVSVAVLEHVEDLPTVVARSALMLLPDGMAQHAIPSEGGALWGLGWRMTTGLAYRIRNKLSYGVAMRHEHINEAHEIIAIIRWFYERVELHRFPLPVHHASFYTYVHATEPRLDRCMRYAELSSPSSPSVSDAPG